MTSPGRLPFALYPAALAAGFILELFVIGGVSPYGAVRALLVVVLAAVALSALGRIVLGHRDRGGVAALLGILLLLGGADGRVVLACGAGFALVAVERVMSLRRPPLRWQVVGRALTAVAAILTIAVGLKAVEAGTGEVIVRALTKEAPLSGGSRSTAASGERPDIYLILLDGYARGDVIEDVLGGDIRAFTNGLEERGFDVSTRSRSNYAATSYTLTSTFAMQRLQDVDTLKPLVAGTTARPAGALLREALNDGAALEVLRDLGYEIHAMASGYEEPSLRQVDHWVDTGQLNEFEMVLLRRSVLATILRAVAPDFISSQHRARIDGVMRGVESVAATPRARPRFVFGHVPSPHAPWVYHADGTPRTASEFDTFYAETPTTTGLTWEQLRAAYVGQAEWMGREILTTVDRVIASSPSPPVIVLFSDHGTWIGAQDDTRYRFRTLLAARSPDGSTLFPDEVATVDLFPILFDRLFGLDLPKHPDSPSYMTSDGKHDFYEIPDPNGPIRAGLPTDSAP